MHTITLVYDSTASHTNQTLRNIYRSYAIEDRNGDKSRISISQGELLAYRGQLVSPDCRMPDGRLGRVYRLPPLPY